MEHVSDDVPEVIEYVPAEQRVQEPEPSSVEYEPIQGEQEVEPGREKKPFGQIKQPTEPPDDVQVPSIEERDKETIGPL